MRTLLLIIFLGVICIGCALPPAKEEIKKRIEDTATKASEAVVDKIIDLKVNEALNRRVSGTLKEGFVTMVKDIAPYAGTIVLGLLAGGLGLNLRKTHAHVKQLKEKAKT